MVESGAERGLQVAVYRGGKQLVDTVAGIDDPDTGRPVTAATRGSDTRSGRPVCRSTSRRPLLGSAA
jgi:hypothetical protein